MKYSAKGVPPQSFVDWLALAVDNEDWTPTYDDLQNPEISDVRAALLIEQAYVCCYCGRGLKADQTDSHLEHFRPQHTYNGKENADLRLEFTNFVASCGPPRVKAHPSTCGDAKADRFDEGLAIEPWDPGCEARFRYGLSGVVDSEPLDEAGAEYMSELLNLNDESLVGDRSTLLMGVETAILAGEISAATAAAEIDRWRTPENGRRKAFSQVAVRYLQIEFGLP